MNQHFLQSPAWEQYEQLEGKTTFRIKDNDYEAMTILESTPLGNYLYCPYGPTLKPKSDPKIALQHALNGLSELAKSHNAFFVRIEPTLALNPTETPSEDNSKNTNPSISASDLKSLKLVKSHDLNPAHTWEIDLTKPREEILKQMRTSSVQYWRSSAKKGITIRQTKDPKEITALTSLLQKVSEKDHFIPQSAKHLKNQLKSGFATLYIVEYTDQPHENPSNKTTNAPQTLAASLVYDDDHTRFYAHAATSDEYRKLNAGIVILVQMILDAKDRGAKSFDFWGITTSDDPKHPWYGFTKFKKSFGGHQINYSGTWDLPLSPTKYRLYRLIRRLNRLRRKLLH